MLSNRTSTRDGLPYGSHYKNGHTLPCRIPDKLPIGGQGRLVDSIKVERNRRLQTEAVRRLADFLSVDDDISRSVKEKVASNARPHISRQSLRFLNRFCSSGFPRGNLNDNAAVLIASLLRIQSMDRGGTSKTKALEDFSMHFSELRDRRERRQNSLTASVVDRHVL